jgi:ABC-type lipoprotein export system ATPase subunit
VQESNDAMIRVEHLAKSYPSGAVVNALRGVSFAVNRGEFAIIMGPSGSGKSTLLNLIGTLDRPTDGRLEVDGVEPNKLSGDKLADFRRNKVGFVFQLFNLIPELTALENVMMPLLPYRRRLRFDLQARARELLGAVGLGVRADQLPGQLSGGEQQRVAIARALVNEPPVVLADEPTGNLDTKASHEVTELLTRLSRDQRTTVLLVTHNPEVASLGDRVLFLRDGQLLEESWTPQVGGLRDLMTRLETQSEGL